MKRRERRRLGQASRDGAKCEVFIVYLIYYLLFIYESNCSAIIFHFTLSCNFSYFNLNRSFTMFQHLILSIFGANKNLVKVELTCVKSD